MTPLTFTAVFRGKRSRFEISPVTGGNGVWHLLIYKYYYGQFAQRNGKWEFVPQKTETFTPAQIAILEEQLETHCSNTL